MSRLLVVSFYQRSTILTKFTRTTAFTSQAFTLNVDSTSGLCTTGWVGGIRRICASMKMPSHTRGVKDNSRKNRVFVQQRSRVSLLHRSTLLYHRVCQFSRSSGSDWVHRPSWSRSVAGRALRIVWHFGWNWRHTSRPTWHDRYVEHKGHLVLSGNGGILVKRERPKGRVSIPVVRLSCIYRIWTFHVSTTSLDLPDF